MNFRHSFWIMLFIRPVTVGKGHGKMGHDLQIIAFLYFQAYSKSIDLSRFSYVFWFLNL